MAENPDQYRGIPGDRGEPGVAREGAPGMAGRDGRDGKDGAPGIVEVDLETIERTIEQVGDREFVDRLSIGGKLIETRFKLPGLMLYRELYKEGQLYEKGDAVTWDSSIWVALKDTSAKPGESTDWRLAVRKVRGGPPNSVRT